jgi:hydroxymethylbilane synthase
MSMSKILRIGTRDSQLAVWQASLVMEQLKEQGIAAELVFIKTEGDIDLVTPLYEMGVQGVFTKTLDAALLNNRIDLAVHSMKDVPTQLAQGLAQAAVLPRASYKDILVFKEQDIPALLGYKEGKWIDDRPWTMDHGPFSVATSSVRRKAQWLHRYPHHTVEGLRGNVNTRLQKLADNNWNGAIFAAAGLERIGLRPENAIELDWMLPAPSQGAIMITCRENDHSVLEACDSLNHTDTALCTQIEKDFLRVLMGGCSTPIAALAQVTNEEVKFQGNIVSIDGKEMIDIALSTPIAKASGLGRDAANQLLEKGGKAIIEKIRHAGY